MASAYVVRISSRPANALTSTNKLDSGVWKFVKSCVTTRNLNPGVM